MVPCAIRFLHHISRFDIFSRFVIAGWVLRAHIWPTACFFFIPSFVANHLEGPIHRVSRSRLVGTKSGRLPIFLRAPTATVFQALVLLIVGRKPLVEMCLRSGFLVGHQWNSVNPAVIFCHQDQKPSKNHRKPSQNTKNHQHQPKNIKNHQRNSFLVPLRGLPGL